MLLMASLFLFLCIVGLAWVSSNPTPNYGALGLVLVAGSGCGFLVCMGSSFLPLILFLVYLGGMVVVFAYSTAFTASFELNDLEDCSSGGSFGSYLYGFLIFCAVEKKESKSELWIVGEELCGVSSVQESAVSVVYLYSDGGGLLVITSLALLVVLLVVLMVVRGKAKGALRAV